MACKILRAPKSPPPGAAASVLVLAETRKDKKSQRMEPTPQLSPNCQLLITSLESEENHYSNREVDELDEQ